MTLVLTNTISAPDSVDLIAQLTSRLIVLVDEIRLETVRLYDNFVKICV